MTKVEDIITNDENSIAQEKSTSVALEETITTTSADISATCATPCDNITELNDCASNDDYEKHLLSSLLQRKPQYKSDNTNSNC